MLKKMIEKMVSSVHWTDAHRENDVAETFLPEKISLKQLTTPLKKDCSMQKGTGMMVCMEQFLEKTV